MLNMVTPDNLVVGDIVHGALASKVVEVKKYLDGYSVTLEDLDGDTRTLYVQTYSLFPVLDWSQADFDSFKKL